MATNTHLSVASWNLAIDAAINVLNSGFLQIYSGAQPATPDAALAGNVLLATLTLGATAFGAAAAGTKTANAITAGTAVATGTASFFRAFKSDDATAVIDGSVGTSAADMIIGTTSIVSGASVSCSSWTVSMPVGQ
jgi:glutamate synthase domain-containing protein 3